MLTLTAGCVGVTLGHDEAAGAYNVPLPTFSQNATSGTRIREEAVLFVEPGQTTREEILKSLGEPLVEYVDLGVMACTWESVDWRWHWGSFFMDDSTTGSTDITTAHYFFVKLDGRGIVERCEFVRASPDAPANELAIRWSRKNP